MKSAFMVWTAVCCTSELDALEDYGDQRLQHKAELAAKWDINEAIRRTRIAWLEHAPETAAL
jgi:hypothetical protein